MKIIFVSGIDIQLPMPLFSISYLSAAVKASGRHRVGLIDCYFRRDKTRYVLERIAEERPDVVGFSVMTASAESSLRLATAIRDRFPRVGLIFGGTHAVLRPGELMSCPAVDAVCAGEGERVLVEYLDRLEGGSAGGTEGFWHRDPRGSVAESGARPMIEDLDSLPYPDWDIWDMDVYGNVLYVLGSRGCPFSCAFCGSDTYGELLRGGRPGPRVRFRSPGNVIGEIRENVRKYGVRGFMPVMFSDSNVGLDRTRFREFAEMYVREGLHKKAPWHGMTIASVIDDEWARLAGDSGCFNISMGLEHPDERVRMDTLGKAVTDRDFQKAAEALKARHIPFQLNVLLGFTGQGRFDVIRAFFRSWRFWPRFLVIHIYGPFPGTRLWEAARQRRTNAYIEEREGPFAKRLSLEWWIKSLNELMVFALVLRLHGLRIFRESFRFVRWVLSRPEADRAASARLFDLALQQLYIFEAFRDRIRDGICPRFLRKGAP